MTQSLDHNEGCNTENNPLEKAEADLVAAERELAKATQDVANAEAEIVAAEETRHSEFRVTVTYDGDKKKFEARIEELVKKLLDEAIKAFGPLPAPHLLSLFNEAGEELSDSQTLGQAGVRPQDLLLLRPSKVKGGA